MSDSGDRTRHWPAIEKKYGEPVEHWLALVKSVDSGKYVDQIEFLQERHGFSRAHANAVVMYARGSTTTKRYGTLEDYLKDRDATGASTLRRIFALLAHARPDLELVLAWNQPMLKSGSRYVFGASLGKGHILLAPLNPATRAEYFPRFEADGFVVNKKTVRVPLDWDVDEDLLLEMVDACAAGGPT